MATKKLAKGEPIVIKDRLYALVDNDGKLMPRAKGEPASIFHTRAAAEEEKKSWGYVRVVRLNDVTGVVS